MTKSDNSWIKRLLKNNNPAKTKWTGKTKMTQFQHRKLAKLTSQMFSPHPTLNSLKMYSTKKEKDDENEKKKKDNKKEYNEPLADELIKPLKIMHRIINQNFYSKEQIIFKN